MESKALQKNVNFQASAKRAHMPCTFLNELRQLEKFEGQQSPQGAMIF
jgi:hypothetical protein